MAHVQSTLGNFLRDQSAEILAEWQRQVRHLPCAEKLDRPAILDHVPQLLKHIADLVDDLISGSVPDLPRAAAECHALTRLDEGFDLSEVVLEYSELRNCILRRWEATRMDPDFTIGVTVLNQAIDRAVAASVDRYTHARDRTLDALDQISSAALTSRSVDELLQKLIAVLLKTTASVDTAMILLREGDHLRARAAVGLEEDVARGFTIRIGEGFAGAIAAGRTPKGLHAASTDDLVKSDAIRAKGVRALYGVPLVDNGDVLGDVLGVVHIGSLTAFDFSDQDKRLLRALAYRATAALRQHMLREALEDRERRLQDAVRSRELLLAVVSHDLRNPLSAIKLSAAILMRRTSDLSAHHDLDTILRSANRMQLLIEDLLVLANLQTGRLVIHPTPQDGESLVSQAVDLHEALASEKGVKLRRENQLRGITLRCDHGRLTQVFSNLIGNAIKFCQSGDVITVRAIPEGESVHFEIRDTGPGIPGDRQGRLFDAYNSVGERGTGLGLFISKGIVEAHGGRIWVESEPGRGTVFHFTIPV